METLRQVYESSPEVITITVPPEWQERRVEVILQPLAQERLLADRAAALGLKLEEVADLHGLKFIGCWPDFPPRDPPGEYETREELP